MEIRIGVRPSRLALEQADEAVEFLKEIYQNAVFQVIPILTLGDKDKSTPLSKVSQDDFFTHEIDQALFKEEIDLAVHSSKDLPEILLKGLRIAWESPSISPYDALVSRGKLKLNALSRGSRIGVSSLRRIEQLENLRSDLEIVQIRGNIDERLTLIDTGRIDALIVAGAALIRLGLKDRIAEVFPLDVFPAHPKQGRLSIVAKENRCEEIKSIL